MRHQQGDCLNVTRNPTAEVTGICEILVESALHAMQKASGRARTVVRAGSMSHTPAAEAVGVAHTNPTAEGPCARGAPALGVPAATAT